MMLRHMRAEPNLQSRLSNGRCMVLTDDYIVCFDYMNGSEKHDYDCIYHLKGLSEINGEIKKTTHTNQLTENPLSSAQFITEVDRYNQNGVARLSFKYGIY